MIHSVDRTCQAPAPSDRTSQAVVAIAGSAGSGKTTLGRALASALGRPILDLDTLTNPLLDRLPLRGVDGHWNTDGPHRVAVRDARYAVLRSAAGDLVAVGQSPILVAPFTAELSGGDAWRALVDAVAPASVTVIHLTGTPELLESRRAHRGADRDRQRPQVDPTAEVAVEVIGIDAALTTDQQVFRVQRALGVRTPVDAASALFGETFDAVLFDLDGTLVDSTAAVHRSWSRVADEFGFDLHDSAIGHGMPAAAGLSAILGPDVGPAAGARLIALETEDVSDVTAISGALDILAGLHDMPWAVVTSGTPPVAGARMAAAAISAPHIVITADDVENGKPDPEPYLLGASRLGVDPRRCLVVEDAPAGITAGRAAGCRVLGVRGTVDLTDSGADLVVDALDQVEIVRRGEGFALVPR